MGCEKSKTLPVEEKQNVNKKCSTENNGLFTDFQVDIVKSTWPLVSEDLVSNGTAVFIDIFTAEPKVKKLFPFRNLSGERLFQNDLFRSHTLRFMQTVESVADSLPNVFHDCPISRKLMVLGAQHATIAGFDVVYFSIFVKCLHLTWERVLGEEYTDDVKDAWSAVFEYIMDRIRDGYLVFNQEQENYKDPKAVPNGSAVDT